MATEASAYLNTKFFSKALEEGFRELGIVINHIEVVDAGIGGDNYCSTIYRAKVDYQRPNGFPERISLIVKSMPNVNYGFLARLQVYAKEKVFYMDIMHRMEVLLPQEILILGAKHMYSTTDPVQTIVLEDLSSSGFGIQSRQLGLDEDHCSVVLKKLGQFHALSMVLMKKDSTISQKFQKGLLHEEAIKSAPFVDLFGAQLQKLASLSTDWEGFEGISHKLFRFYESFSENVMKAVFPLKGKYINVLNHGDLWVNNLLFKLTEDDNFIDMRMIDFQFSFCGSPGFDLNYFFYTSLQLDVLKNKRNHLIEIYHRSLEETLMKLQHDFIPSIEDVENEISSKELYGFFVSFAFFPMMSMHKEDSVDNSLEGMQDSEIAKNKIELMFTTNKRTLETLKFVLNRFDEIGVLG